MSAAQSFSVVVLSPAVPVFSMPAINSGQFQAMIGGSLGPDYSIYTATNLASGWTLLLKSNSPALPFLFSDSVPATAAQRYYRVLLGP